MYDFFAGSDYSFYDDYSSTGYPGISYPSEEYGYWQGADTSGGAGENGWSSFWNSMMGSGTMQGIAAGAASGYFGGKADAAALKQQLKNAKELYSYKLDEDERMRQIKGKELADAYKAYESYYQPNKQSPFAVMPQKTTGLLGYGY